MIDAFLNGYPCKVLKEISDEIIVKGVPYWVIRSKYKLGHIEFNCNHIDIKNVAPLNASLKMYGARIHTKTLQDLPINPDESVHPQQYPMMKKYNINDTNVTLELRHALKEELELREVMSEHYDINLMSCSDPQVGEKVLAKRCHLKRDPSATNSTEVKKVYYDPPDHISFDSGIFNKLYDEVCLGTFRVTPHGKLILPDDFTSKELDYHGMKYKFGVGGLHSMEKKRAITTNANSRLELWDVSSYYPFIIVNNEYTTAQNPNLFLHEYDILLKRRLEAKARGDRAVMDSLRIAINGCFGKFGSMWSPLYSPKLLLQVTVTGQLQLLMLIEEITKQGGHVVSANTDGVVVKYNVARTKEMKRVRNKWCSLVNHELDVDELDSLFSRDVNNYIMFLRDGKVKRIGTYADQMSAKSKLFKNPNMEICTEAAVKMIEDGTSISETIFACNDIRKFIVVRHVRGGCLDADGNYLGTTVRWYYGKNSTGFISRVDSGAKVPLSDAAEPLMVMGGEMPNDINYNVYIQKANEILHEVGYKPYATMDLLSQRR